MVATFSEWPIYSSSHLCDSGLYASQTLDSIPLAFLTVRELCDLRVCMCSPLESKSGDIYCLIWDVIWFLCSTTAGTERICQDNELDGMCPNVLDQPSNNNRISCSVFKKKTAFKYWSFLNVFGQIFKRYEFILAFTY